MTTTLTSDEAFMRPDIAKQMYYDMLRIRIVEEGIAERTGPGLHGPLLRFTGHSGLWGDCSSPDTHAENSNNGR